jgi:hypothetical protein
VIAELRDSVMADLSDYVEVQGGRLVVRDMATLTRAQMRRIKRFKQCWTPEGEPYVEIELHDQAAALDKLAKAVGLYNNETTHQVTQFVIQAPAPASSSEAWEAQAQALASRTIEHEDK